LGTAGCALFTQAGYNLVAGDWLHSAAFQVVITAIEHFARVHKLGNLSGQSVLKQLVRRTSSLADQLVNLGLQGSGEMYFHGSRVRENPAHGNGIEWAS
jgi:hypothetical protein